MTVNSLPPQAYTKETLQKAYTWLLNQAPAVKDLATNQETLVSLYLRAVRNGDVMVDTPSVQNFKQELKSLANLMGELQTPPASQHATVRPAAPAMATTVTSPSVTPVKVASANIIDQLDEQSLMAVREVRIMLNLGSDVEALRALIALGHKQFKKI
jgi:hypothetical protein